MKPVLALALCLAATASAQTFTDPANLRGERVSPRDGRELPIDQGATGLAQLLRKINTRASLMNIVAHPDDEDGGMLTLYSRGLGARVADLSLNRGEGGQNAMTADFEDALGLLRTQELLASDRYSGVDQFFGTQVDFGFSKTKSESFAKWGHDKVLYDVVRAIRIYRPLVITSTWIGGVTDGHGQHQVSGQIAQEAFVAAGDSNVFPELTKEGILPWQPLKIYARVPMQAITPQGLFDYATGQYVPAEFHNYVTGESSTAAPSVDIVVHEGTKDPLITYAGARAADLSATGAPDTPLSYVQFSRIGLGLQKSQIGPGVRNAPTGVYDVSYHLYGDLTCGAPAILRPTTATPQNCHAESSPQGEAEGLASKPASPQTLAASGLDSQPSFFDGIDTTIEGIVSLAPTSVGVFNNPNWLKFLSALRRATKHFNPAQPEQIAQPLAEASHALDLFSSDVNLADIPEIEKQNVRHELLAKLAQINEGLILALSVKLEGTTTLLHIDQGSSAPAHINLTANNPHMQQMFVGFTGRQRYSFACVPDSIPQPGGSLTTKPIQFPFYQFCTIPSTLTGAITRPYFQRSSIENPVYQLIEKDLRNAPGETTAIYATALLKFEDAVVEISVPLQAAGHIVQIVPAANVSFSSHAQVAPKTSGKYEVTLSATGTPESLKDTVIAADVWPYSQKGDITKEPVVIQGTFPIGSPQPPFNVVAMHHQSHPPKLFEGYRPIGYDDLPRTNLYAPATVRIVPDDLKLPTRHNIAYLPGTGDDIPAALDTLSLRPTVLAISDLVPEKLKQFDTVILGVRTYNAHPDLHGRPTQALLEYARNGGNVLVQFQTQEFTADDAPYPLNLGTNEKVVDETAPVRLWPFDKSPSASQVEPVSAVNILSIPNKLTPADFNGWNEERGHGFLSTWDAHYTALLEVHDPGEPTEHILPQAPQRGGLITVQLGKGRWTYCAFALYRQLPEAVPGAFRLFANLINP